MSETIEKVLKRTEAFSSLGGEEIATIAGFSKIKQIAKDQRLFKEGEAATDLWVVISGKMDLRFELPARQTTEAHTISTLSQNGIVGWSSLIPPFRYKLSAYCASPTCELVQINGEQLVKYLKNNPDIGYRVLSAMIRVVGNRFEHLQAKAEAAPLAST